MIKRFMIQIFVSVDCNAHVKVFQKHSKSKNLKIEIIKIRQSKAVVMPVMIGAFGHIKIK